MADMAGLLNALLLAVLLLALVHFLLPHQPLVRQTQGRLFLWPPLRHLLERSATTLLAGLALLALSGWLLSLRAPLVAGLLALLALGLCGRAARGWYAQRVVFDRAGDRIVWGGQCVGRPSEAVGVQVTGEAAPALELFLHPAGEPPTAWAVPEVDAAYAPRVGAALAAYLGVSLSTRMDPAAPATEE
jgi:hypothetical protein